jgi:glyoxylase-like metal-dependent hydrolase (beta-lactamase superfamily II)
VFTHYHYDHVGGQQSFPNTVKRIGHRDLAANLFEHGTAMIRHYTEDIYPNYIEDFKKRLAHITDRDRLAQAEKQLTEVISYVEEMKKIEAPRLDLIFTDKITLDLGGLEVEVIHPGPGHTGGNCVVYFPKSKVVHTGDLVFNGSIPFIDGPAGADTGNWAATLRAVIGEWDIEKVIPGHGPVTDKQGLKTALDVLEAMRTAVASGMKEGKSMEEMQQSLEIPLLKDMPGRDFLPGNIEAIYNEFKKKE